MEKPRKVDKGDETVSCVLLVVIGWLTVPSNLLV